MSVKGWLSHRLIVISGKGGVGRSTIATGLGMAAAKAGKRALIVELSGASEVAELVGLPGRDYQPRRILPGLDIRSLTAAECLDDFGRRKLHLNAVFRKLFNNRVSRAFLDAVPGLHDLLQLGKIENLLMEPLPGEVHYDVAILDAPATGHGLTLLSGAMSMATMTRVGPFHDLALTIAGFLADADRTALLLTTLPEALPVHECIEAMAALERDDAHLAGLVLNRVRQNTMPSEPAWKDVAAALTAAGGPWANVVPIAALQLSRERAQSDAID